MKPNAMKSAAQDVAPNRVIMGRKVLYALIALTVVTTQLPSHVFAQQNEDLDRLFDDEELDEPKGTFQPPNGQIPPGGPGAPQGDPGRGAGLPGDTGTPPDFGTPPSGGTSPSYGGTSSGGAKDLKGTPAKGAPGAPALADAQIEDMTDANYPDLVEANFPNAEITDVVKAISQLTNKNFIIDPGVRGKITIIAPTKVTVAEAYKAFLAALAVNGFTVVPYGKFLKVKASRNAQRDSIETYTGKYAPTSDIYITRIIHLKHISAEEVNKRLRVLPSKDGEMTPYEPTNSLLITDYGANVERMVKIINELDRPGFEEQLAVIKIRYAKVKELADLINQIINKETKSGGSSAPSFGANVPRFRSRGGTAAAGTPEELSLVAPDDRTNALIVVGNKAGIEKVRDLVKKLDYKLDPAEAGGVFVYYVRYGEAEKIATTISGLASGTSSSGASSPAGGPGAFGGGGFGAGATRAASPLDRQNIFGGDVKVNADKNTNSLVITASKQDYDTVRSLLAKLDIPRDQVFVETIIMEMNAVKTRDWNPAYYSFNKESQGKGRMGFSRGNLTGLLSPLGDKGAILGFGSGDTFDFSVGGTTVKIPSLIAFINFIQQNVESNILSTPRIMALDNEEAMIEVGDKVPVGQTTTSVGNNVVNDVKTDDATIKLVLTPFIRPDSDVVRMKLEQSVKQVNPNSGVSAGLAAISTTISNRTIKTNIVVNSGDTAVLGGLIRDEESIDETKIPILGDIPVLGWLFKSRLMTKKKINLVVFITPRIIRGGNDSQNLLSEKAAERIDWIKRNYDGRDPNGAKMDSLPRTAKRNIEKRIKKTNNDEPVNIRR